MCLRMVGDVINNDKNELIPTRTVPGVEGMHGL